MPEITVTISNPTYNYAASGGKQATDVPVATFAKSHAFDEEGNETNTDYLRMMKIVIDAGYRGYVGIEWEGGEISEEAGILKTKALLERVREELSK